MKYSASLDNLAKSITIGVTILIAVCIAMQVYTASYKTQAGTIAVTLLLLLIYFGTYAFCPLYYEITRDALIIHRPSRNVVILKSEIRYINILEEAKMKSTVRLFAVGGFFGYFGQFSNTSLGRMTLYVTRRDRMVLIQTVDNRNIVLSPDLPIEFIKDLQS